MRYQLFIHGELKKKGAAETKKNVPCFSKSHQILKLQAAQFAES